MAENLLPDRRDKLKSKISSIVSSTLPMEEVVKQLGNALMSEIPRDRFALILPNISTWV